MVSKVEAVQNRSHTMLIEGVPLVRPGGQIVVGIFIGVDRTAFEEVNRFIQHAHISGAPYIAAGRQGQPEIIIGAVCANASARGGMPPMLYVPFLELTTRTE